LWNKAYPDAKESDTYYIGHKKVKPSSQKIQQSSNPRECVHLDELLETLTKQRQDRWLETEEH